MDQKIGQKINRVKINDINGKKFNKKDTYAIITNDFLAGGGDTYFSFKNASAQMDTGVLLDAAVVDYITEVLGGVVGSKYAAPQGRITIK